MKPEITFEDVAAARKQYERTHKVRDQKRYDRYITEYLVATLRRLRKLDGRD